MLSYSWCTIWFFVSFSLSLLFHVVRLFFSIQLKATKMEINCRWKEKKRKKKKNCERYLRWMVRSYRRNFIFIPSNRNSCRMLFFFFLSLVLPLSLAVWHLNCLYCYLFLFLFFRSCVSLLKVCDDVVDDGVIVWPSCMHDGNGRCG